MWVDFVFFRSTSSDENSEFNFQAYRNIEKVLKNPGSLHPSFTNFSCLLYSRVSTPQQRNVKLLSSTIPNSFYIFFLRFDQAKRNPERLESKPSAQPAPDLLKTFSNIDGKNSEIKYIYLATLFAPTLAFEQRTRTQESKCALVQS